MRSIDLRHRSMIYRALASLVVVVHGAFIVFVIMGGLLVLRHPALAWLHAPAAVWGTLILFGGWTCPLTPFENWFRMRGGKRGYEGGFIDHYFLPAAYRSGWTRGSQMWFGFIVLALNLAVYVLLIVRSRVR